MLNVEFFPHGSHGSHGFLLLRSSSIERPNENPRCLQRKRIREIREIRVGNQEGSGQDEQASVQGDELTMLNVE